MLLSANHCRSNSINILYKILERNERTRAMLEHPEATISTVQMC